MWQAIVADQSRAHRDRRADAGRARRRHGRAGGRPDGHHRRAGLAQAGQVRRLDRHLHGHAGVDLHAAFPNGPAPGASSAGPPRSRWCSRSRSSACRRGAARRAISTSGRRSTACCSRSWAAAIVVQTLSTIAVAVALWRQRFDGHALGWALRLGMMHHDRRRDDRRPDDAADRGAAGGRARR